MLIPGALTKDTVDKINKTASEYGKTLKKFEVGKIDDVDRYTVYEKATREILELTLQKFNYVKEANNPDCGPALLGSLAGEIRDFILAGGKHGMRLLQTRLNSVRAISSNTSQN